MANSIRDWTPLDLMPPYLKIVVITRIIFRDSVLINFVAEDGRQVMTLTPFN